MSGVPVLEVADLPELRHARALWGQSRWEEGEAAFLKAVGDHPHNLHALLDTARVLGDRLHIRRARELLTRLETLAAGRPDLLLLIGQTMRICRRETEALELFRRYAAGPGKRDVAGHLERAVVCERHRLVDEADAAASEALKASPGCMEALIIRARVRRQQGQPDRAAAALQRVTGNASTHPGTRAQAWTMLADMADRDGDAALAMQRLERAKQLMRPGTETMAQIASIALGAWERVCRELTRDTVHRWMEPVPDNAFIRPAAHLLSFPRSGTTLLENILDAHSGIVSSEERQVLGRDILNILWREAGVFTPPAIQTLDAIPPEKLSRLRRDYRERLEEGLGEPVDCRVHIDKNPTHTLFIPGIIRLLPDSRFLVALRDPRDVVISCYFQYLPLNPNSVCFLSWEQSIRRYLLDMGCWLRLREVIPSDRWLEVRYENVVADMPGQARRAVDFLSLPWEESVLHYREQVAVKAVHTPSYQDVNQALYTRSMGRWHRYAPWMEPHLGLLRPMVEALGYEW